MGVVSREWERALERQLALIEWHGSGHSSVWMDLFTRLYRSRMSPEPMRKRLLQLLQTADTYFVSDEMTKLVEVAAESIGDPVLEAHVPFTKRGFVYFQRPIRVWAQPESQAYQDSKDGRRFKRQTRPMWHDTVQMDAELIEVVGALSDAERSGPFHHEMLLRGLAWVYEGGVVAVEPGGEFAAPADGVTWFLFGSDTQLAGYEHWMEAPREEARVDPMWDTEEFDIDGWATSVEDLVSHHGLESYRSAPDGLSLIEASSWTAGRHWTELTETEWEAALEQGMEVESAEHVWFQVARVRRIMFALWSFMAQPIATPRSERPAREYRRRWEREVGMPNYGDVRVVTLRRSIHDGGGEPDEEFGREWSHRWVVRGFWRNQWYPSEGVHRMIWIDSYIKGPEDRPLIIKDSVFQVVR